MAKKIRWRVASREGDVYRVYPDDGSPTHSISVRYRHNSPSVSFTATFPVRIPVASVTADFTMGLLIRNHSQYFGQWNIEILGALELVPYLHYATLRAGLDATAFKVICEAMQEERAEVHRLLRNQWVNWQQAVRPTVNYSPSAYSPSTRIIGTSFL